MSKKKIHWDEGLVMDTFGLKRDYAKNSNILIDWVSANEDLSDIDLKYLEKLRNRAEIEVDSWNEEELKMNYLSFIVAYADYSQVDEVFRVYYERPISAEVQGHKINVIVDFMIAQGVLEYIKKPYFCFHEYKRAKKYNDDPAGQALLAMLAAQEINKNNKPVYGAYIIGKNWHFMVLENKNYAISKSFDCTQQDDLFSIISILRKFKIIIKTQLL